MNRPHRLQTGGAAKEIILVLAFLIFIAYMSVAGMKSTLGVADQAQGVNNTQPTDGAELKFRIANLINGVGIGLILSAAMVSTIFSGTPTFTDASPEVATRALKTSGSLALLGGIFGLGGGIMYYMAGASSLLTISVIVLAIAMVGIGLYGLVNS